MMASAFSYLQNVFFDNIESNTCYKMRSRRRQTPIPEFRVSLCDHLCPEPQPPEPAPITRDPVVIPAQLRPGGKPRQRKFKPKVRTGCQTCKLRHLKCDEGRPACQRCVSSGRTCGGYEPVHNAQSVQPTNGAITLRWVEPSSQFSHGTQAESDAFSYFENNIIQFLSGAFHPQIWRGIVLPVSATEPAVKHAVIALGSIRKFEGDEARKQQMSNLAFTHYSKALKALHTSLSVPGHATADCVLVTCLLFIAFELQQYGLKQVHSHFQGGVEIVRQLKEKPESIRLSGSKETLDPLIEAFERLDVQMSLFTSNRVNLNQALENRCMKGQSVPLRFASTAEASRPLNRHLAAMREILFAVESRSFSPEGLSAESRSNFQAQIQYQLISLHNWSQGMDELLSTLTTSCSRSAARAMQSHHLCCKLLVSTSLNEGREMLWDSYIADFKLILDVVDDCLVHCAAYPLHPNYGAMGVSGFSLDMGIIPPLYLTAVKCRDPALRRRALALLEQCKHQEGAWDGRQIVGLATQIVELEERGLGNVQAASDVPERNRFCQAYYDLRESTEVLTCRRRRWESDGQWTVYQVNAGVSGAMAPRGELANLARNSFSH